MLKTVIIISAIFLLILSLGAWFFIVSCSQSMYIPGNLSQHLIPAPPNQNNRANYWQMEPDISVYHFEDGNGATPVLIIHGGPGFPINQAWTGLKSLGNHYRFVYYHQRGCGKSTRPIDKFSSKNYYQNMQILNNKLGIDAQLADIERIRQILHQDKLIIIGHSFGGFLATMYAAEFPERVAKLILVAPAEVVKMPQKDGGLYELTKHALPKRMIPEYNDYLKRFFDYGHLFNHNEQSLSYLNYEFVKYFAAVYLQQGNQLLYQDFTQSDTGGWVVPAIFFGLGKTHDYGLALRKVKAPVLIIAGKEDLMPVEAVSDYLQNLKNNKLIVIDEAGHFPFEEAPEEFAKTVGEFLGKKK